MLWNWYTVDTCFLSTSWRIRSGGGFAALCIGIILMAIALQALAWLAKFYDQRLVRQVNRQANGNNSSLHAGTSDALIAKDDRHHDISAPTSFRPNVTQQAVRTLIRTAQFAMAYWIMLLAMYYNGYVIICIILGSFIGIYFFQWDRLGGQQGLTSEMHSEPTGCCG
jgi:solute carrier family 31 (copper transporter), member 1